MRTVVFNVKIPIPDTTEFREITFNSRKEVCDFLQITQNTLYSITSGRLKHLHSTKKHLENITIESVTLPPKPKVSKIIPEKQFLNSLIDKCDKK